jgi:hypothetical protein
MCEERILAKSEVPVLSQNLRVGTEECHDHVEKPSFRSVFEPGPPRPNTPLDFCRYSNLTTRLLPTGGILKCLGPKNEIFALQRCYTALIGS